MAKNNRVQMSIIAGALVVIVALITTFWWLFASGRLTYQSRPNQQLSVACDQSMSRRYNEVMRYEYRESTTNLSRDQQGIKDVRTQITNQPHYEDDATCQTMLFWIAVNDDNLIEARTRKSEVERLHEKGSYADSDLITSDSLSTWSTAITEMPSAAAEEASLPTDE